MEEKDKSMKKKVSMGTENASLETKRGADMSKENEGYSFNHAVNNRENEIEESNIDRGSSLANDEKSEDGKVV